AGFTLSEGMKAGDRDTAAAAYNIPKNELAKGTRIGLRVTNTGDVPLKDVALTDKTHQGASGSVTGIICTVDGKTVAGDKIGNLAVGEFVDCKGTLTGVKDGKTHADTATASGKSIYSGKKVTDEGPWFAKTPAVAGSGASLAATGGAVGGAVALGAGLIALLGAAVATFTRRRSRPPRGADTPRKRVVRQVTPGASPAFASGTCQGASTVPPLRVSGGRGRDADGGLIPS
ncbi:unnamed protein product, partial [Penicillium discolor]